jgi:hypothetical protein
VDGPIDAVIGVLSEDPIAGPLLVMILAAVNLERIKLVVIDTCDINFA